MHNELYAVEALVHAVVGNDRREETGNLVVALAQDILMVEPDTFLIVELGAALRAFRDVESLDELVE